MNEIWIHKQKNELITDLKNMISDLEDEHYSSYSFFEMVERKVERWKTHMKMDEETALHGEELKQLTQSLLDVQDERLLEKCRQAEKDMEPALKPLRDLWNKFKQNIVPYQCFTCNFSDFLPTEEYLKLEKRNPKIYPICDFECGANGYPLDQLKISYRIGICKCKLWKIDLNNGGTK